jgi:hypothetical protein
MFTALQTSEAVDDMSKVRGVTMKQHMIKMELT